MHLDNSDIVVISNGFWDEAKRIRHKMPQAWACAGNRVLWIEQPPFPPADWRVEGRLAKSLRGELREVMPGLWVGTPPPALPRLHASGILGATLRAMHGPFFAGRVRRYLAELGMDPRYLVLIQQPTRRDLLRRLPHKTSIYYVHDLYRFGKATQADYADEARCCAEVDVVFATSEANAHRLRVHNPHTYPIPHALDLAWWRNADTSACPQVFQETPGPRVVYTGVTNEKINAPLLRELAGRLPDVQFYFVGPMAGGGHSAIAKTLSPCSNIHFPGSCPIETLPAYLVHADILMLPYVCDTNRKYMGLALKMYEYLISGKPILATPYTDFEFDATHLIHVADTAEAWAQTITRLLDEGEPLSLAEERIAIAEQNTYAHRIEEQRAALDTLDK